MKNSGIEWIGNIPNDWKLESLKGHLEEVKESNDPVKTTQVLSLTNKLGVIPYEEKGEKGNKAKENYNEYKLAYPNTIVVNSMNILIGSVGICNYFGCVSPVYYVLKPKNENELKFLDYIFQSQPFQKELRRYAKGILEIRLRVSASDILRRQVAFPTIEKQKQITAFIDEKCGKIDELIANQEKQIEKLKEYKQSVITEAVTKGLDKSVPMKDSGIEWIGNIPNHWNVCRIKSLADNSITDSFIDGDWIESPDITDEGIRYLTTGNVGDGVFKCQGNGYVSKDTFNRLNCKYAYPGDLVISRLNSPYGRSCILPDIEEEYVLAVDLVILRTQMEKRFICYSTQCVGYQHSVEDYARGTAMKRISRTNLGAVQILIPKLSEQKEIADYLDEKCGKIDRLIAIKQEKIEKLQEYKKSLIYEYVTGKKEVV